MPPAAHPDAAANPAGSQPTQRSPATALFVSSKERALRDPKRFLFGPNVRGFRSRAASDQNLCTAGIGTFENRTHHCGPTTGPQLRTACHSSCRRIHFFFHGPTAVAHRRPIIQLRFATQFINAGARSAILPPPRCGPTLGPQATPRATLPVAAFSFFSTGPQRGSTGLRRVQPIQPLRSSFLLRTPNVSCFGKKARSQTSLSTGLWGLWGFWV